ncbi:MAG: response regulator [bacterium]|nr:response regulator [bacterium]
MEQAIDKTVLVVDDEPNVRDYLAMILQDAGFTVITAGDGLEALEKVRAETPDFISLDLIMPNMSGHKLLYELRRDKDLARIPVLVVTAHAGDEMGKEDLKDLLDNRVISGPGTYLEKPVNPTNYVASIKRALGLEVEDTAAEKTELREELRDSLGGASPDAMKEALEILRKSQEKN